MVVKITVFFWFPIIIRPLIFRGTQKGTIILTTTRMLVWCVRFYWFRVLGLKVFKGRGSLFFPVLGPDKPATICPASNILHLLTTADLASRGHTRSIYGDMWVVPRPSNPKPETLNPCTPTPHTCNPAIYSSTWILGVGWV